VNAQTDKCTKRGSGASRIGTFAFAFAILASALWAALAFAKAEAPTVSTVSISHITETSVRLEGTVNPHEREVKAYFFEYVDQASFEEEGFEGASKTPSGKLPTGKATVPVTAQIDELTPGTTYHLRLFAENSLGKAFGTGSAFSTFVTPEPLGPCPNDSLRNGAPSAALPDCRAYEQASPVDKNGGDVIGTIFSAKASVNGDRVLFDAYSPLPGGEGAQVFDPPYLATRGPGGWSTQGLLPPLTLGDDANLWAWTPDFSHVYDETRKFGEPDLWSLIDRSSADHSIATIVPDTGNLDFMSVSGSSDDGSIVFFESEHAPITENAVASTPNLYAWDRETGAVRLVGVFNDGKASPGGSFAGSYDWLAGSLALGGASDSYYTPDQHANSIDGARAFFTAGKTGQLYMRENPAMPQSPLNEGNCTKPELACTIHVSTSHRSEAKGPDPAGSQPAAFLGATPDGSHAFFTSSEMLTNDANTGPEQPPAQIGRAKVGASEAEEVKPNFLPAHALGLATSPDGEYVYWADPSKNTIGRAKLNGDNPPSGINDEFITPGPTKFETHPFSEPGVIHQVPSTPRYVAVNSEYVYWTNTGLIGEEYRAGQIQGGPASRAGTIGRAKLDGSGNLVPDSIQPEFITGASDPQGIALTGEHVYWTSQSRNGGGNLGRATLEGAGANSSYCSPQALEIGDSSLLQGIAISGGEVYIGAVEPQANNYSFVQSNQLATCEETSFAGFAGLVRGVAVDGSHVYWSVENEGIIGRVLIGHLGGFCGENPSCEMEYFKPGGGSFGLVLDGERLYWSSNGEGGANPGNDLYRYDAATGDLTDLAPDPSGDGAEVQGILGSSEDGSYVYFVANGALAEGASAGDCHGRGNSPLESLEGTCNLYVEHEGQVKFIAPLESVSGHGDVENWRFKAHQEGGGDLPKVSLVSADGRTLLFRSMEKLTSYENEGTPEFYRYRFGDPDPILCVSCNPTGAAPSFGAPRLGSIEIPGVSSFEPSPVLTRNLSADGNRVFFETTEALLTADTNGDEGCPSVTLNGTGACQDVYEWEAKGTGSCHWEIQDGGCLYLISTGKSPDPSYLLDASAGGNDVFIFTRSRLVAQDEDSSVDVYDARVGGGFAAQNEPPPPPPCEGEACKHGATPAPEGSSPGTPLFSGPGNPKPRHKKPKPRKHSHKHKRQAKDKGRAHR
jgi:hypothetical protein